MRQVATSLQWAALMGAVLFVGACSSSKPVPVPKVITAKTPCGDLTFAGFPHLSPDISDPYFVCKKGTYALEFNPKSKTSLWVTEHLMGDQLDHPEAGYTKDYRPDPDLGSDVRSELYDYLHQGYEPGLMAPVADFQADPIKMSRAFYLSNAAPQNAENQKGIWRALEHNVRQWAQAKGELFVITGPVYPRGQTMAWIGGPPPPKEGVIKRRYSTVDKKNPYKGKMGVPYSFYKVIYDPRSHQAVAFIIPNQNEPVQLLPRFATSVAQVEAATRLTFFPNLPAAERQQLVNTVTPQAWILH